MKWSFDKGDVAQNILKLPGGVAPRGLFAFADQHDNRQIGPGRLFLYPGMQHLGSRPVDGFIRNDRASSTLTNFPR